MSRCLTRLCCSVPKSNVVSGKPGTFALFSFFYSSHNVKFFFCFFGVYLSACKSIFLDQNGSHNWWLIVDISKNGCVPNLNLLFAAFNFIFQINDKVKIAITETSFSVNSLKISIWIYPVLSLDVNQARRSEYCLCKIYK